MSALAINGGKKTRTKPFPRQITIGEEEKKAVNRVLDSKRLSAYRGIWGENFWGGPEIQSLVEEFKEKFGIKYAIPCNSCTSGLHIAFLAASYERVAFKTIVSPWSMSCSASTPYVYKYDVDFADLEENFYIMDPIDIMRKTEEETCCFIMVDLFGQPYNRDIINAFAKANNIIIIEDTAQAIGSTYHGQYAGTLGDMGVFSFTQGKHLTAGEGGMIITDNKDLAIKCHLIMNHAEAVVHDVPLWQQAEYENMFGFNLRMTEIQAAIIREQLKKLDSFVLHRKNIAYEIEKGLRELPFITPSLVRPYCSHSYYVQAFKFNQEIAGVHRDKFINAVKAELTPELGRETEGVPIGCGYIEPLYRFPLFKENFPKEYCPVVHKLWKDELFLHRFCGFALEKNDLQDIFDAFYKVWENIGELK